MTTALAALAAAAVLVPAHSAPGAGAARPPAALSAAPARITVVGAAGRRLELRNVGAAGVRLDVTRTGRGASSAAAWIRFAPRRLALPPGGRGAVTIRIAPPRGAAPGDHDATLLLTTRPLAGARVAVRMRLGVLVRVRVPGRIVHRLRLGPLRVERTGRARVLGVTLANRGNVAEDIPRGGVVVRLVRNGRVLARLRAGAVSVLPSRSVAVHVRYRGRVHGRVAALVSVGRATRRYRIAL